MEQEGDEGETSHVRLGSFNCKFWPRHQRCIFKSLSSRAIPPFSPRLFAHASSQRQTVITRARTPSIMLSGLRVGEVN